ncbi:MAG TPA: class I SAM-dependent methyltransferase [Solirubrobacteraceae bacterium]|nr:class I SAM-dependent methyltransferase [Solirubrobacteraceae bacterium]
MSGVVWHDLECGSYVEDLPVWLELADGCDGRLLDVGAGTGRVTLPIARAGHQVVALERDTELASELRRRAAGLDVEVICGDACDFTLDSAVDLALVPMQTVHLLEDLGAFLRCTHAALRDGGRLAVALLGDGVEPFELELEADTTEIAGVRYASAPTALRRENGAILLERRRTRSQAGATQSSELDTIHLRELDAAELGRAAHSVGFQTLPSRVIAPTREHAGSEIALMEVRR